MGNRSWRGVTLDGRSADMMEEVGRLTSGDGPYPTPQIGPVQGSFSTRVQASKGTHSGGGAIDLGLPGAWSETAVDHLVLAMRRVGWAAWYRPPNWDRKGGGRHVHGIAVNCPTLARGAARQVLDYLAGRNGLANGAPDTGPRQFVRNTWEAYRAGAGGHEVIGAGARPSGPFPVPGGPDSMYGVSTSGKPYYSGKAGSAQRSRDDIRERIRMIQRAVGAFPDGDYGDATEQAVRRWQQAHGLQVDGLVGPQTWASLTARAAGGQPVPIPLPIPPLPPGPLPGLPEENGPLTAPVDPGLDPDGVILAMEPRVPWDPTIVLTEELARSMTPPDLTEAELDC